MEQIINYVKPELIVVAIVLYFIGMASSLRTTGTAEHVSLLQRFSDHLPLYRS